MFREVYYGKRVLVTGHTGFKGTWLISWLKELGAELAGFSNGVPTNPSHYELIDAGDFCKNYIGDIRNFKELENAILDFNPQIIFHLAAQALVQNSFLDPVTTFETNILGMVNLLTILKNVDFVEVGVLITSDKAYENKEWSFGYREIDRLSGHDPYSASKSCADIIASSFYDSYFINSNIRLATTRAGNVIGGGDWAKDRIIPDCIRSWSNYKSVMIRSPKATRPWQHVLEPLSGYLSLGAKLYLNQKNLNREAFNFGPESEVNQTVEELLVQIKSIWPEIKWEIPEGNENFGKEANLLKLSCDKVLHFIEWKPTLKLEETIEYTINWYKNWIENKKPIREFSQFQINEYCNLARARKLEWIQ